MVSAAKESPIIKFFLFGKQIEDLAFVKDLEFH
jgi:hypothetical protein